MKTNSKLNEQAELLLKEMRYISGISTGQVKRVAEKALKDVAMLEAQHAADDKAGGEVVAWYVLRSNPGKRDHGLKYGPFWKRSDAEELADVNHTVHALYTRPQPQAIPAGYALVPVELDWNMEMNGIKQMERCTDGEIECIGEKQLDNLRSDVSRIYRAILSAAPKVK